MKYVKTSFFCTILIFALASCDLFINPYDTSVCDGTWSINGTNENGSTYFVEIYVFDGHISRFVSSTTDSATSNAFSFRLDGINGASIAEIFYDEEIENYTNSNGIYSDDEGTINSEGYLEGIDGYWYVYDTEDEHFQGYFHPEKGVVEGSFHFKGSYDSQGFVAEKE